MALARQLFPDDSVLHVGPPARDYRGLDVFLRWYRTRRETAGEGFRYEVREFLNCTDHVAALITLFTRSGESMQVAIYKVASDRITDIWLYEHEPFTP